MESETSEQMIDWFAAPISDLVEYKDDFVEAVLKSPIEHWEQLAICWYKQNKDWKDNASLILDELDDQRRILLLQELIKSPDRNDVGTAATLISQLDRTSLAASMEEQVVKFVKQKWQEIPEMRRYIEVACRACRLDFDSNNKD